MKKRKMLLYMSDFYGYYNDIIEELGRQNWDVKWYMDQLRLTTAQTLMAKLDKQYKEREFDRYFQKTLEENRDQKIDMMLVIFAAGYFRPKHMTLFKQYFPKAEVVYYTWDSLANYPATKDLIDAADRSYTFDLSDSEHYQIDFLPLFYIPNLCEKKELLHKCSSIMSFQAEKGEDMKRLLDSVPEDPSNFIFLRVGSEMQLRRMKIFHKKQIKGLEKYFQRSSLSREEVLAIFASTKAVIDCPRPQQNGLTMRTFEVLSLGRKLITTNTNVKRYDFYSPNNIFVVNDEHKKVPDTFFETPFDMQYAMSEDYSLPCFIRVLTGGPDPRKKGLNHI